MPRPEESEQFVLNKLNPGALEADLRFSVEAEVRFDSTSRALYSTDASNYREVPIGVVIPRVRSSRTPLVCQLQGRSQGGGTLRHPAFGGQAGEQGLAVLIRSLDEEDRQAEGPNPWACVLKHASYQHPLPAA